MRITFWNGVSFRVPDEVATVVIKGKPDGSTFGEIRRLLDKDGRELEPTSVEIDGDAFRIGTDRPAGESGNSTAYWLFETVRARKVAAEWLDKAADHVEGPTGKHLADLLYKLDEEEAAAFVESLPQVVGETPDDEDDRTLARLLVLDKFNDIPRGVERSQRLLPAMLRHAANDLRMENAELFPGKAAGPPLELEAV